jgi:hypothetical protein
MKIVQIIHAQIYEPLFPYNLIVDVHYKAIIWENVVVKVENNVHFLAIYTSLRPYFS